MAIYKRGKTYWFNFWWRGRHIHRSTKQGNPRVARQMEAACRTALAKGEVGILESKPAPAFSVAIREFLNWSEQQHKSHPRTHRRYLVSARTLLRHFKDAALDRITQEDVEKFKAQRAVQKGQRTRRTIRPATVNRELACLKAMYNHAIKSGLAIKNPVSFVKFLPEDNEQMRVLTLEEQQRYLGMAPPTLYDVATLILETGMRPEEVYRIRSENVHVENGYLFNPYGKTKAARRKIPLNTKATQILIQRLKTAAGAYLFPYDGDPNRPIPKANNAHDRALKQSGLLPFRLYDLRHTWATRAAMSGIDLVTLAAMLGHSRIQMVLRYAHPTEQHQAEAMRRLERFTAEQLGNTATIQ
jgi:integrase